MTPSGSMVSAGAKARASEAGFGYSLILIQLFTPARDACCPDFSKTVNSRRSSPVTRGETGALLGELREDHAGSKRARAASGVFSTPVHALSSVFSSQIGSKLNTYLDT